MAAAAALDTQWDFSWYFFFSLFSFSLVAITF
jgi:hypothetical protein